jgi:hypothetical protein
VRRRVTLLVDYGVPEGSGWADASISDADAFAAFEVSYISDALRDFLAAVAASVEGAPQATCIWQDEPGEHRWVLSRDGNDLRIRFVAVVGTTSFATTQPAPWQLELRRRIEALAVQAYRRRCEEQSNCGCRLRRRRNRRDVDGTSSACVLVQRGTECY